MNEDRAREGVEHLQTAALELIAAMRAFLDVAEEVVKEPGVASTLLRAAAATTKPPSDGSRPTAPQPGGGDQHRFQRIDLG